MELDSVTPNARVDVESESSDFETHRTRSPEERKLELEIEALERPWNKRLATYINAGVAASALIAVIGQSFLSNIKT